MVLKRTCNLHTEDKPMVLDAHNPAFETRLVSLVLSPDADSQSISNNLKQMCAFFLVSADPLSLMITLYDLLTKHALKKCHTDPLASERSLEAASAVSTMAGGFIHTLANILDSSQEEQTGASEKMLQEIFELKASYTPARQRSILGVRT